MSHIPIIDLKNIISFQSDSSPENFSKVAYEIQDALHQVGFMYIVNHGVPSDIIKKGFEASEQFFKLDPKIKEKYRKDPTITNHGWIKAGQELLNENSVFELRESFDFVNSNLPIMECTDFHTSMAMMQKECRKLIKTLIKLIASALELDDLNFFLKCSKHLDDPSVPNESDLRVIYYPAIPNEKEIPKGAIRCSEHTDYEMITILFQDDVGGLEIKNAEGRWVPATPVPGALLINTGDLLQIWTNSYFPATMHRVVIPTDPVHQRIARYSFAYFFAPDNSTLVSPLNSKIIPQGTIVQPGDSAFNIIMHKVKKAYQY